MKCTHLKTIWTANRFIAFIFPVFLPVMALAEQTAERLIQQEQQRLEQQRRDIQTIRPPARLEMMQPEEAPQADGGPCLPVNAIHLEGALLLDKMPAKKEALLAPFVGDCLDINGINRLLRTISNVYFDKGYVTSRAYVPEQDLSSGELRIIVIEGHIEGTQWEGSELRHELDTALPEGKGRLLNLRDLEQAIDQINRLSSNRAQMQLLPGTAPGQTVVRFTNTPDRRYHFSAGLDNSGQRSTGRLQRKMGYIHDNLLGINDLLAVNIKEDGHRAGDDMRSRSASLYYEIPYGYWTLDFSASYFEYASTVAGFNAVFHTRGISRSQQFGISRILHRDRDSKTGVGLSLTRKDNLNYLEDVLLESSSRVLTIGKFSANHMQQFGGGLFSGELAYHRGLGFFDSLEDHHTPRDAPRAEFDKFSLDLQYRKPFANRFAWPTRSATRLYYQYSDDVLFASEQASIGGQYSVNGYHDDGFSGDTGGYFRQGVGGELLSAGSNPLGDWFGSLDVELGMDMGTVKTGVVQGDEWLFSGWLRLQSTGNLRVAVTYAEPFNTPAGINRNNHELYASLTWTF